MDLAADLAGQQADTVAGLGWAGVANGELLRRAAEHFDAFLTMDRNLEHQQNLAALPFGVLVLRASSNRLIHLRPLIPDILDALKSLVPGQVRVIGR